MVEGAKTKSHMGTRLVRDWALMFSPVPLTLVALFALAIPPLDRLAPLWLTDVLDVICGASIPTFWCRIPRPAPWFAAVQAFDYLAFLIASLCYVLWIRSGRFPKPPHYVPGSATTFENIGWLCVWLFVFVGAQVFPERASPFSYFGLIFTIAALSFGLMCMRNLAISIKYRRHNEIDDREDGDSHG